MSRLLPGVKIKLKIAIHSKARMAPITVFFEFRVNCWKETGVNSCISSTHGLAPQRQASEDTHNLIEMNSIAATVLFEQIPKVKYVKWRLFNDYGKQSFFNSRISVISF